MNADEPEVTLPATVADQKKSDQQSHGSSSPSVTGDGIGSAQNQTAAGGGAVEKDQGGQSTTRG